MRAAFTLMICLSLFATRNAAARVAVRPGPGNHAELYETATGQRLLVRGVNYVRTTVDGARYHNLFCKDIYHEATVRSAMQAIHDSGYNVVRSFLTETCLAPAPGVETLDDAVVDKVANFIYWAAMNGLRTVLTIDQALPPGYARAGCDVNGVIMVPACVSAKGRMWRDLVRRLDQRFPGITGSLLAIDIANEPSFYARDKAGNPVWPFAAMAGAYDDPDFGHFDLSSPADRQKLADDTFARYASWIQSTIAEHDPQILVTVGMTSPFELGYDGYNGLDIRVPSRNGHLPGDHSVRFAARVKAAEPFLDYFSIHSYPAGLNGYDYMVRTLTSIEYTRLNLATRPVEFGELGSVAGAHPSISEAAAYLRDYVALIDQLGAAGYTMWTWDTFEYPELWTLQSGGGAINAAVSPVGYPGYGHGSLVAGVYNLQQQSLVFHNGQDAACTFASMADFTDITGLTSAAGIPVILGVGAVRRDVCRLVMPAGLFRTPSAIYRSNGTAYCAFPTWPDYVARTGQTTPPDRLVHRAPDMPFQGACQ